MISFYYEGESFNKYKQSSEFINSTVPKGYNLYNDNCTFYFSYLYLSLAGNIIVYTPDQGTNREKYFHHIIYQRERMPTLAGKKHPSVHFFPHGPRPFHLSTEKSTVRSVGNGHQSGYSRADIINKNINKRSKVFPYKEKIL